MNHPAYLSRIGYTGPVSPTLPVLRALHHCHMLAVPFENLDISRGRKIVLEEEALVRKIVDEHRGGFCYEMNGAFAALLRTIGFQVTLLSAQVFRQDGSAGPEFDHLTLQVDLEKPWLADVGFGDSFLQPLRLQGGMEQEDGGWTYRIAEYPGWLQLERRESGSAWKQMYRFTLQPRQLPEFATMCDYHQTSPDSSFTRKRLCTRPTPKGRITLSEMKLVISRKGDKQERMLSSEEEWRAALQRYFEVKLD